MATSPAAQSRGRTGMTAGAARQDIINRLATDWKPQDIRSLAATLLRLADSLDQGWDGSNVQSIFRWPSALARIERNAMQLAMKARLITEQRGRRRDYIDGDLLGEPAWDMLLDLFMQFAGGASVSTTSLCIASRVPGTTALRYITLLEDKGYVARRPSEMDGRVMLVSLTDTGVLAVGRYLEQC
ncbi:winged helix DNA-binding protein [Alteraurantiacibacter buctensis]|uniref:Winged helix DNA-binding protein n=1 Tax=Alteraurantiacibacter buctensis TaxID=1503981 RepID=A0A844YV09_9SPHN|nr:winged helix DNA-binding protein [Alteraurantiacibacter buctensis]MXO71389.1 winged helix DNA-binding protein [Alteraurantiacibacter buctensis]